MTMTWEETYERFTEIVPLIEEIYEGTTQSYAEMTDLTDGYNLTNITIKENFHSFYQTEQIIFLCILFAFIMVGNICVVCAILLSEQRKSRMNFFILQLAIADLASGMITVLTDIIWKTTVHWYGGHYGCKIIRYLQCVATYGSTYVLVALSIDRLDAIARPMHFTGSGKRGKILIFTAWVLSFVFSIPMLILNKGMTVRGSSQCWMTMPLKWHWRFYVTVIALLLFIIPAIFISICYSVIVIIIWKKSIRYASKPTNSSVSNGRSSSLTVTYKSRTNSTESHASSRGVIPKARIKTIKMTLVIVLVFIFCWSPFFVFDLLDVFGLIPKSRHKVAVAIFIQSLAPLNSAANPIIYCLFSTNNCINLRKVSCCDWFFENVFGLCFRQCRRYPTTGVSISDYFTVDPPVSRFGSRFGSRFSRRHSSAPFLKTLNQRENIILSKYVKPEIRSKSSTSDSDPTKKDKSLINDHHSVLSEEQKKKNGTTLDTFQEVLGDRHFGTSDVTKESSKRYSIETNKIRTDWFAPSRLESDSKHQDMTRPKRIKGSISCNGSKSLDFCLTECAARKKMQGTDLTCPVQSVSYSTRFSS